MSWSRKEHAQIKGGSSRGRKGGREEKKPRGQQLGLQAEIPTLQ